MSQFQQHSAFFNKPIILTEEEKGDPMSVIIGFFTDYNLSEVREIHQNMVNVCLTSNAPPFDDPEERDNLIAFRESEEKLMEAALILMESPSDVPSSDHRPRSNEPADHQEPDGMDLTDVQDKVSRLQSELAELQKSLVKPGGKGVTLRFHSK